MFSCSFETNENPDWCGFLHDTGEQNPGNREWSFSTSGTGSSGTGPSHAAHGVGFIFVEASHGTFNHKANLTSVSFPAKDGMTLQFQYHMYGADLENGELA